VEGTHGVSLVMELFSTLLEEHSSCCFNAWVIDILPNCLVPLLYAACQHHKGGTNACRLEYVSGLTTALSAVLLPNTKTEPFFLSSVL